MAGADIQKVVIETGLGEITVGIAVDDAPVTASNFLDYVDRGDYDRGLFHRTVTMENQPSNDIRIEVIQAGINPERKQADMPPIPLERTSVTGIRHLDGTISMARFEPDSAVSDFFICIGDQPELDFGGHRNPDGQGFAAFGRVVEGMELVRAIQHAPHEEQKLTPPVQITRIRRADS